MGKVLVLAGALAASVALVGTALATHAWGNYHWARVSNPLTLNLGDNVSTAWDSYLATTSSNWSTSTVLKTSVVPGAGNRRTRRDGGRQ